MSDELYRKFEPLVLEYRLYYDNSGKPISMSSHNHPEGKYVVISKEQYEKPNYNCQIIDGVLKFDVGDRVRVQLKKSHTGVPVVAGYPSLVVEEEYPEIEYYDRIS